MSIPIAFAITLLAILSAAALYTTIRKLQSERRRNNQILTSYNTFDPSKGIPSATEAAATYMRATGTKIYNIFNLSHAENALTPTNDAKSITLNEKSSAVKAFFTITPRPLDPACENDKILMERYGKKAWIIPLAQAPGKTCWKQHGCQKNNCMCHGLEEHHCWLKAGKTHHTSSPQTYTEKERKCTRCPSFLPIAVLIGHGKSIKTATLNVNETFGPLLKTSAQTRWAAEQKATDPLTGVASSIEISRRIEPIYSICKQHNIPLSVCAFEVDNPAGIIEHYGIYILQSIIQQTIATVTPTTQPADICGKMSDDDTVYLLILPNREKGSAIQYAGDLRESIANAQYPYTDKQGVDRQVMVRISAGVAEIHADEIDSHQQLIKAAYTALYNAKTYKNKVLPYTDRLPKPPDKKAKKTQPNSQKTKKKSTSLHDIIE